VAQSILALLLGLMLPLAMAPFHLWPLIWLSIAGYFVLIDQAPNQRRALWLGWVYGAGMFGLGISWVYHSMRTVATPVPMSLLLTSLFCLGIALLPMLQAGVYHRYLRPHRSALWLAAPLLWMLFEWVRSWLFTGMPWLLSGYALTDTPMAQLAAVFGVYGLGTLVVISAGCFAQAALKGGDRRRMSAIGTALVAVPMAVGWALPATRWTAPHAEITAVAVQSNVRQADKWAARNVQPTLDFYARQARQHSEPDLMLWPEAALTVRPQRIPNWLGDLDALGKQREQAIITGIVTEEDGRFYNALLGFGESEGEYRKQHLVPFGEYLPFEQQLRGLIEFFSLPMSTLTPAPEPQSPLLWQRNGQSYRLAPVICYEAAYPGLVRQLARNSDLMILVSNDAWFGDSLAPHQHLQITRMRAIENSRAAVRATQNGISALIDADGRLLQRSRQFEVAAISGEVTLRQGMTPYQRWGGPYWVVLPLVVLVLVGWRTRK
jgi:apolipoprotein N-acyltransferase